MKHLREMLELLELTEAKNSSIASIRNTVIMLVHHLIKMIVTKVPTTTRVYAKTVKITLAKSTRHVNY